MRLLLDQNRSRLLIEQLPPVYRASTHVTTVGLDTATDRQVWEYARVNDCVIVSKDAAFSQLAFVHGAPPKIIWLRVGNATTRTIRDILIDSADAIAHFVDAAEDALLILPSTRPRPQ